jgi:hypothetical protein
VVVVFLAEATERGALALLAAETSKPLAISSFRRLPLDQPADQFTWGTDSELFYVRRHPSGPFIYSLNLSTSQVELITMGSSPAYRGTTRLQGINDSFESLYFFRDIGYSIEKEFWRYDHFLGTHVQGEHKESNAINPAISRYT